MTATIIPFPGKRARPLELHELPEHWSQVLKLNYLHCTYDGWRTHEDMWEECEHRAQLQRMTGESENDFILRCARDAIARLPPRMPGR